METYFGVALLVCGVALLCGLRIKRRTARSSGTVLANPAPPRVGPAGSTAAREMEVTVVLSNLNDFSEAFGRFGDPGAAALLNEYLAVMIPVVQRRRGFLVRMAFDQMLVVFGPILGAKPGNHAAAAVAMVLEMQAELDALNRKLAARGIPPLAMRAAVATGTAYVGDVGSTKMKSFTAIGPAVNEAERLETACKESASRNLANVEAWWRVGQAFEFREVTLPGGEGGATAFEALSLAHG